MKSYISDIFLFSSSGEKRNIFFSDGLNIITGDSKTGKSAIIEIVDFCMFSARSTIPVGKVTDWADLFCVVYTLDNKKLVVARSINNKSKGYFSLEDERFDTKRFLTKKYIESLRLKDIKLVQKDFEQHFGLSVSSTKHSDEQSPQSGGKATIRDCATVMFQHQNLVANKHSIFYRFDDFYKRSKFISDFPIHLGWADANYYLLKREHENLLKRIKRTHKSGAQKQQEKNKLRINLETPIKTYYQALGLVLDSSSLTLVNLKKIASDLPEIPKNAYEKTDLMRQLKILKDERSRYYKELSKTKELIDKVSSSSGEASDYSKSIGKLLELSEAEYASEEIICPVCKTEQPAIVEVVQDVITSRHSLMSELSKVGTFKQDNTQYFSGLLNDREKLKAEINNISKQINHIEKSLGKNENQELRDKLLILKGRIETSLEQILEVQLEDKVSEESGKLANQLEIIEAKLAEYDLKNKIQKANLFINDTMNQLKSKLDFEVELKGGEMRFDLETFNFSYFHKGKSIILSEMGSGANWLACHLCLFLALLKLSCKENSSIPTVLFFDQPSQVYFPKTNRRISLVDKKLLSDLEDKKIEEIDENIKQVIKIFTVMDEFLIELEKDKTIGFKPQIIVLEHADEPELNEYVVERWSKDGKKLV
ncbi:DUF3732 domain-containing protein [Vibrio anguillarum]|uniref:DUF3732 domain-containing protein n=1 Tax=Vibrio anguillarum TaxID=55601 RepID=UPI001C9C41F3|nr:DUF3732 domain-containing protein [Vibrio anguillarum]MBY7667232.1 DUF3732 domain-containing protein [Vibrio anguillarum]